MIRHSASNQRFVVARHEKLLQKLGLTSFESVRTVQGTLLKNHHGRRDVVRLGSRRTGGPPLFLKRTLKPYWKDGLGSLLRRGRIWSAARQEWENAAALEEAGFRVAPLVAYGEELGLFREKFSFLITEQATGEQTVGDFLERCRDRTLRQRVLDALAIQVRRMHEAGFASPDLFTRHFFLDLGDGEPRFCLIDMGRLNRRRNISRRLRARDLAALNITAPPAYVAARERVRFLRIYGASRDKGLIRLIRARMKRLLIRRKYRWYFDPHREEAAS